MLSAKIDLLVVYCLKQTPKGQSDAGFGIEFDWDVPLLEGYKYKYLENYSKTPSSSTFKGITINKREFDTILGDFNPSHVLVHGWFPKAMLQAISVCRKRPEIKIMCRGDSTLLMTSSSLKRIIKEFYIRWVVRGIHAFLFVGKENRKFYTHYGVPDSRLYPAFHCINTDLFKSLYPGKIKSPKGIIRLGFIGKFISKKEPILFIKAVSQSLHKKNIELVFIGGGPLETEMKEACTRNNLDANFLGFLNQTELVKRGYPKIDCLILPSSLNETWGLVVNEALTLGIPAIVSNKVGCHSDLIVDGKTGYVFESQNVDDLIRKIDAFCQSILEEGAELFETATKNQVAPYSSVETVKSYLKVINLV